MRRHGRNRLAWTITLTGVAVLWAAGGLVSLARAQPYGLASRPSFQAFASGRLPGEAPTFSGNWTAVVAFPNLSFLNLMGVLPMPGTSNLVAWEREGRIYQFANDRNTSTKSLMLDITPQCQGWDDSGLMGIAFHPGFQTNGYLFVYYTYVPPGTVQGGPTARPPKDTPNRDRLERYTLDAKGAAIPGSATVFLDQVSETVWHNGGGMFFHPGDGFLYLTNGDDARSQNNQRINYSLHGGILRIDVDQRGGPISHPIPQQPQPLGSRTANYYIPNDNPFVGQPGVLEEFFALGLRSPHRMTIDPPTGRIFIGDVGDASWEELDLIEPKDPFGLNFQWNRIEGNHGRLSLPYLGVDRSPVLDYSHSDGAAIIGGYVYRGREFAADLGGKYLFGDNIANVVWVLDESTRPAGKRVLCTMPRGAGPNAGNDYVGLSSFGYDQEGELYLCQLSSVGGRIYRLERGGAPAPQMPRLLSETGVFGDLASLQALPGLVAYEVNSPLWSDGALKTRWFGIPDGKKIGFSTNGEWTFPEGSVWVKHFELGINTTNAAERRRLETRVLVRDTNGYVYGASYRWRADHSDAEIVNGGLTEDVTISLPRPVGELRSVDVGQPAAGETLELSDGYQLRAGGLDIWGTRDEFRFSYEQRSGDFDVAVRIAALTPADLYTKAGLMVRDSLAPEARHVFALVFPSNAPRNNNAGGYEFQSRATSGGNATAIYPPQPQPRVNFPNTWLRLRREGHAFTAYSGSDGEHWQPYATQTLALPNTLYLGLAVTAHAGNGATATAEFHFRTSRTQAWYFPSRQDCLSCHTRAAGGVLGMKTRQSNGDHLFTETGLVDNQLRAWNHAGYFDPSLEESTLPSLLRLVAITNQAAELEFRVRSYLDANCSHCHRPGGARANWDARIETPLGLANIVGGSVNDDLGIPGARNISPQEASRSLMYQRMSTATAPYRMPPLAKNVVDQPAVDALLEWLNSLAAPPAAALTSPVANSLYYAPVTIPLSVRATSTNGPIVRVDYYTGQTRIGSSTEAPFTFAWDASQGGAFELTAFATDSTGLTGRAEPVRFNVISSETRGLLAQYWDNQDFTGPQLTRLDPVIDIDWGTGPVAPEFGPDTFSARWTGRLRPRYSESYTFYATSDDGIRVTLDGRLLINSWIDQAPTVHTGTILLKAEQFYDLRVEFYENSGGALARLEWSSPSQPREVIPSSALFPPPSPNQPPVVALVSPAPGTVFYQPASLALEAGASDPDGTVARVEFFADGLKLGESAVPPYRWAWQFPAAGPHALSAKATDNGGAWANSATVSVTIEQLTLTLPPQSAGDGRFHLQFNATAGLRYRVEKSTDLREWISGTVLTAQGGQVEFAEPFAAARQFYRVVPAP